MKEILGVLYSLVDVLEEIAESLTSTKSAVTKEEPKEEEPKEEETKSVVAKSTRTKKEVI